MARDQVIQKNMGLVYSIVSRYAGRGYDTEELSQIGAIGLIKAVDKFDMRFDVKFSTYAVPMISGEIKRFLRDDGMVKVSRSIKENGWKIRKAADALSQKLDREPSIEELAATINDISTSARKTAAAAEEAGRFVGLAGAQLGTSVEYVKELNAAMNQKIGRAHV